MATELLNYRKRAGATQTEMANAMGMPLRSYQDVESGKNPFRPIHAKAADLAMITLAIEKEDSLILHGDLEDLVRAAAKLLPA